MNTTNLTRSPLPSSQGARLATMRASLKPVWLNALAVVFFAGNTLSADTFGNFSYTDNGTSITITGCTATGPVTIPDTINGKPVTAIGWKANGASSAFSGCAGVTSIHIPSSVTSMLYGYLNLHAQAAIFSGCTGLTTITVDAANQNYSAENGVLFDKLKKNLITYPIAKTGANYTIPNGVEGVGFAAFSGCAGLTSISTPDSLITIGKYAFSNCSSLTSFVISASVTIIEELAFVGCASLTNIIIPSSVTSIGDRVFSDCGLESLSIKGNPTIYSGVPAFPGRLTSISATGNFNFSANAIHFPNVTSVTILGDVPSIAAGAYAGSQNLSSITINPGVTFIGNGAFSGSSITNISIPNSVTSIGDRAFSNGGFWLRSIILPEGLTSIGNQTFLNCFISEMKIPDSVTAIGNEAFRGCSSLQNVTIPSGIISIGNGAFMNVIPIWDVTFPASLTTIGSEAFYNCSFLRSARFLGNGPPSVATVFDATASGFTIYYKSESTGFTTPTWSGYPAFPGISPLFVSSPPPSGKVGSTYDFHLAAGDAPSATSFVVTSGAVKKGPSLRKESLPYHPFLPILPSCACDASRPLLSSRSRTTTAFRGSWTGSSSSGKRRKTN